MEARLYHLSEDHQGSGFSVKLIHLETVAPKSRDSCFMNDRLLSVAMGAASMHRHARHYRHDRPSCFLSHSVDRRSAVLHGIASRAAHHRARCRSRFGPHAVCPSCPCSLRQCGFARHRRPRQRFPICDGLPYLFMAWVERVLTSG